MSAEQPDAPQTDAPTQEDSSQEDSSQEDSSQEDSSQEGSTQEGPAETVLLLHCHGLDDLPENLAEPKAAAALNAFALAWHPALLAAARALPRLVMADQPPRPAGGRRFLVPNFVRDLLPDGWEAEADGRLAIVGPERSEGLTALAPLLPADRRDLPPADLHTFFALGLGHLWIERLTRRTHYYSTLDETRLRTEAVAAADALLAGDREETHARLVEAAEVLREARERFYPTPAKMCDLCFVLPRFAGALSKEVAAATEGGPPLNLMGTGADWQAIAAETPGLIAAIRDADGRVEPVGGEQTEAPTTLRDLPAAVADLSAGRETFRKLFGSPPRVWGRYRYGFTPLTPQLLESFGVRGALHLKFGPGEVPPDGAGRVRWAGAGGEIPAHARDPLPADRAASFWNLPEILAEAFESEQTVAVTFARWPGAPCAVLDDLKALTALSPALGEFATFTEMFEEEDPFARVYAADPRKYRSPGPAAGTPAPLSSHSRAIRAGADARSDAVLAGLSGLLGATGVGVDAAERLAAAICRGGGDQPGTLWLNPLPVPQTIGIECGNQNSAPAPPADHPAVKVVGKQSFTFEVPPGGFVWFPDAPAKAAPLSKTKAKTAEPGIVRNERFEVRLDPATGGIAAVKTYGRNPVRLGMRPAVKFNTPRTLSGSPDDGHEPERYSRAVRVDGQTWDLVHTGPARGEIVSRGDLIDPAGGARLCGFTLRVRLDRGARTAMVEVAFTDPDVALEAGDLVLRWAWDDETAELARSLQGSRQAAPGGGTFEAPHFWELTSLHGDKKLRTAVLTPDAPFHTRSGRRMLDSPLLIAGETPSNDRVWRFGITLDDPHPMRAADAFLTPPIPVPAAGPPASGPVGWLMACDSPGVRVLSLRQEGDETLLRLQETDGRTRTALVRCFKRPAEARKRSLAGEPRADLACEGDAVRVPLAGYELSDVAVRWA